VSASGKLQKCRKPRVILSSLTAKQRVRPRLEASARPRSWRLARPARPCDYLEGSPSPPRSRARGPPLPFASADDALADAADQRFRG